MVRDRFTIGQEQGHKQTMTGTQTDNDRDTN
jgi:hypothetical protein